MKTFTAFLALAILLPLTIAAQTKVVPLGSNWKYLDNGSDQGTVWRSVSFDDSNWKSGNGRFGYDYDNLATVVSYGPDEDNKYITTYFRKSINIADVSTFTSFTMNFYRDDAVVVYVNGKEVFRDNMPEGNITYTTFATKSSNADSPKSRTVSPAAFVNGTNVIAVEVHQQKLTSSDLAFDLELVGTQSSTPSNQTPGVSMTNPANGANYTLGQAVSITASASDPDGTVEKVEFFANGSKVGEDTSSPYSLSWTPASAESYTLTARATDNEGASATSGAVSITVNNEQPGNQVPTVSITSPQANAQFELEQSISIAASAADSDGNITLVEFFANSAKIGEDASSPYSLNWTPSGTGAYTLTARSTDNAGAVSSSDGVSVNITSDGSSDLQGFTTLTYLNPIEVSKHTADKPQSKVWKHAGKWWTVLPDSDGTHVWRLDGTNWTRVLTIASTSSARADCKVVGDVAHILLFRGSSTSYLLSIEYVAATGSYKLWSQRTARVSLGLEADAETATIDIDSKGRMWLATDGPSTVNVRWSDAPYSSWSSPIQLASNITEDDICAVVAMPGKIGVLWSNQNTKLFGFRTHTDGAAPGEWSADELPASQSAQDIRYGMADDHLNMAIASDGTLYCAVKTGFDTPGYTKVALMVRRPSGVWDNLHQVTDEEGTRPIIILNEAMDRLKIIYTDKESGGNILYRESRMSSISFGDEYSLFAGDYNYATSTKHTYSPETVIFVTNEGVTPRQAVSVLASNVAGASMDDESSATAIASSEYLTDNSRAKELIAYPNPFRDKAKISFGLIAGEDYSLMLFNSQGALIAELQNGHADTNEHRQFEVDGTGLSKGLYFVRLQTTSGSRTVRLMLAK